MTTILNSSLSKESKTFLENLRLYLFSSGKQSDEIDDILTELEVHLLEAEKAGKPIEKIVGDSPKAYMESLSSEMKVDVRTWMKYAALIVSGAFSFQIMMDLVSGYMAYSLYTIVSHITITLLWLILLSISFKYIAANTLSKKKEFLILTLVSITPLSLFFVVIFTDSFVSSPVIVFNTIAMTILGIITSLFIIVFSIWSKTWILVVCMVFLVLPDYLLQFSSLQESTQLIVGVCITYGGIMTYMLISTWIEGKKTSTSV
ncbi:DUF1129 family protein [Alkalicoccobacillus plakortidis]|uniref:DUF1129 family protein n=1 Tax=Alkalicoccobacillus plakortidis TaxID=444060 RepID=A0ABT0XKY0_9BACI|nr:DUF1129 family protein [Alkalicoccobacillus plakortidis]MCM2676566.1 DUF1129 family protein [Alkalicoccobacillus plakortidis]